MSERDWHVMGLRVERVEDAAPTVGRFALRLNEPEGREPCVHELNRLLTSRFESRPYLVRVIAKAAERAMFLDVCSSSASAGVRALFDLSVGRFAGPLHPYGGFAWNTLGRGSEALGDGWHLVWIALAPPDEREECLRLRLGPCDRDTGALQYAGSGKVMLLAGLDLVSGRASESVGAPSLPEPGRIVDHTPEEWFP